MARLSDSSTTQDSTPHTSLTQPILVPAPSTVDPQLALILAKLNELDAIKLHLHTIDNRLDTFQTPSLTTATVAQRS